MTDLKKLKLVELKRELSSRNLNIKGNKAELLQRLQDFVEPTSEEDTPTPEPEVPEENVAVGDDDDLEDAVVEGDDGILEPDEEEEPVKEDDVLGSKVTLDLGEPTEEAVKPEIKERNQITIVAPKSIRTSLDITDEERKRRRSEKFTTPQSEDAKKASRAKRFGGTLSVNSVTKSSPSLSISTNADILRKRAERFGSNVSPVAVKAEEKEKLLKRKQRFGGILAVSSSDDLEAKKKKRTERFAIA